MALFESAVLQRWHDAVNAGDIDGAVACCSAEVAVKGPRGVGHGRDLVRAWLDRSGIRLEPQGILSEHEDRTVVRESAWWTAPPDASAPGPTGPSEPTETWCVFTVAGEEVTSIARYAEEDEVPPA